MKAPLKDSNKYCIIHKDTNHWIMNFRHLKWEIECQLSKGYLGDLVYKNEGTFPYIYI